MGARKFSPDMQQQAAAQAEQQRQQRPARLSELRRLKALQGVPDSELDQLVDLCVLRAYPAGRQIIRERERGGWLCVILAGAAELSSTGRDGTTMLLDTLEYGDSFGEGLLFGDYFQRTSVQSIAPTLVLQIELGEVRTLLPVLPHLEKQLRALHSRRLTTITLARVPLFSGLTLHEREPLIALLHKRRVSRGDTIITQGTHGDTFYIIENGQTAVERDDQTIATLGQGDFFGEMSLLTDQPHNATIRAVTPTDVLMLPASEFHALLRQRPDLSERLKATVQQRRAAVVMPSDQEQRTRIVVEIIQHGLLRGRYLLVRTPERCPPDCRICEQACRTRHGNTRLHLNGVQVGPYDVVDSCRQCEISAECVESCPEDAIRWNDNGALIITDACTGCGNCSTACPYNAVDQVPRRRTGNTGPLLWLATAAQQRLAPIIPLQPVRPTHRADKCDYCDGFTDMACVHACPKGSLQLVPVEQVLPL